MSVLNETDNSHPGQDSESLNRGNLAPHAASVLMKLLYAVRIARFDLLRSINALARNVTKWTKDDDARLHHLMCFVNSTIRRSPRRCGILVSSFFQKPADRLGKVVCENEVSIGGWTWSSKFGSD